MFNVALIIETIVIFAVGIFLLLILTSRTHTIAKKVFHFISDINWGNRRVGAYSNAFDARAGEVTDRDIEMLGDAYALSMSESF